MRLRTFLSCTFALLASVPTLVVAQEPEAFFGEPRVIANSIEFATRLAASTDGGEQKNGFYPELSNMVTGAGWISIGPGYRHWLLHDHVFVEGSTAISWRAYKMAQGRFELPRLARSRLAIGMEARWQDLTQVTYFGEGPASAASDRSEYRLTSTNLVTYATVRPRQWLAIDARAGWLAEPEIRAPAGTFQRGNPDTRDVFGSDIVYSLEAQPSFAHREISIAADTRNHRGRPTAGGVYRTAWSWYTDQDLDTFSFRRYEAEAAHFLPTARSRIVFALHGYLVASSTGGTHTIPFYLLPALGGHNTLRGFSDYRFHDRNLLVINAESRLAVFPHIDAALFVDAGNVAPRMSELDLQQTSYGVGVRVHTPQSTFARVDLAKSREGWQFLFRLNDPLRLSRLTRRTAAVPFVP